MAPTQGQDALTSTSSPLQIALGVTLPFLLVASFIPIIMIHRHLSYRTILQPTVPAHLRARRRRIHASRLPLSSIYITRVDYYLPPTETATSLAFSGYASRTDVTTSTNWNERNNSALSLPIPPLPPLPTAYTRSTTELSDLIHNGTNFSLQSGSSASAVPPAIPSSCMGLGIQSIPSGASMGRLALGSQSLPSLNSDLCEFAAYAGAIDSDTSATQMPRIYGSSLGMFSKANTAQTSSSLVAPPDVPSFHSLHPLGQAGSSRSLLPARPGCPVPPSPAPTAARKYLPVEQSCSVDSFQLDHASLDLGLPYGKHPGVDESMPLRQVCSSSLEGSEEGKLPPALPGCDETDDEDNEPGEVVDHQTTDSLEVLGEALLADGLDHQEEVEEVYDETQGELIELDTSQIDPLTTSWSLTPGSNSTLASVLSVRLSQFPQVPNFYPQICKAQLETEKDEGESDHSEEETHDVVEKTVVGADLSLREKLSTKSSEKSNVSQSLSLPVSLNLLEVRPEEMWKKSGHRYPFQNPVLYPYINDGFMGPGELWDEDDDLTFSICIPRDFKNRHYGAARIGLGKSMPERFTWTAGMKAPVTFAHGNPQKQGDTGDLWDEDDDRRISQVVSVRRNSKLSAFNVASFTSLSLSLDSGSGSGSQSCNDTVTGSVRSSKVLELDFNLNDHELRRSLHRLSLNLGLHFSESSLVSRADYPDGSEIPRIGGPFATLEEFLPGEAERCEPAFISGRDEDKLESIGDLYMTDGPPTTDTLDHGCNRASCEDDSASREERNDSDNTPWRSIRPEYEGQDMQTLSSPSSKSASLSLSERDGSNPPSSPSSCSQPLGEAVHHLIDYADGQHESLDANLGVGVESDDEIGPLILQRPVSLASSSSSLLDGDPESPSFSTVQGANSPEPTLWSAFASSTSLHFSVLESTNSAEDTHADGLCSSSSSSCFDDGPDTQPTISLLEVNGTDSVQFSDCSSVDELSGVCGYAGVDILKTDVMPPSCRSSLSMASVVNGQIVYVTPTPCRSGCISDPSSSPSSSLSPISSSSMEHLREDETGITDAEALTTDLRSNGGCTSICSSLRRSVRTSTSSHPSICELGLETVCGNRKWKGECEKPKDDLEVDPVWECWTEWAES